jgi:peptidoglycan/LPS O-acetylase OafA/YrhL
VRTNWFMSMGQWTISGLLRTVPYGRYIKGGGAFDGSLWSLPYEVLCYLLIALLAGTAVLSRAVVALLLLSYAVIIEDFLRGGGLIVKPRPRGVLGPYPLVGSFDKQLVVYLAFLFLLGAAARLYAHRVPVHGALAAVAGILLTLSLWRGAFYVVGLPAEAYLLLYAMVALPRRLHAVGRRRDYSYGIYIYAFPVQQLVAVAVGVRYGFPAYIALSVAGALVLAALSWHLVEHPALTLKDWTPRLPRWLGGQETGVPLPSGEPLPSGQPLPSAVGATGSGATPVSS